MEPYRHRIFLCTNNREGTKSSCTLRGSQETFACLKEELVARGLQFDVKVVASGCLGLCEQGPNAIVYPEGVWYSGLNPEDVPAFVETQLIAGERYTKKALADDWVKDFFEKKIARKKQ